MTTKYRKRTKKYSKNKRLSKRKKRISKKERFKRSKSTRKRRRRRRRNQRGGGKINITAILIVFFAVITYLTGISDHGKTIDDYITINEDGLPQAEQLGVGLVKYDSRIYTILDKMLSIGAQSDKEKRDEALPSYTLELNDDLQIYTAQPLFKASPSREQLQNRISALLSRDRETDDTRELAKQMNHYWLPQSDLRQSFPDEGDINIMLETFMPTILRMANTPIGWSPTKIEFSGTSQRISRSPLGPQIFHQDEDSLALRNAAYADHEYRIMLFDRDEGFDPEWTHFATEIDGKSPEQFVRTSFPNYDFARLIDFDVKKSEYIGLIFDNKKVFHRTPPTTAYDWIMGNIPRQRRVVQFLIYWDNYDQLSIEEIMGGGGYRIV